MSNSKFIKNCPLLKVETSLVIQLALKDRRTFEASKERKGLIEPEVICLMKFELKQSSSLWRKRVIARDSKHRSLRNQDVKFSDQQIANFGIVNC